MSEGDKERKGRKRGGGGQQGDRLRLLRTRNKLSQLELAERLNLGRSTVAEWETGVPIPAGHLAKLRELFPDDLLPGTGSVSPVAAVDIPASVLPFAGNVPATSWDNALDGAEVLPVNPLLAGPNRYQCRVVGQSCEPALYEGDVVVFRRETNPDPGALVLAQRFPDSACTVKQLRFAFDGEPELWPVNGDYKRPEDGEGWAVVAVLVGVERKIGAATIVFQLSGRGMRPSDLSILDYPASSRGVEK